MGWAFVALWVDDPDTPWHWVWRRTADDSGVLIAESARFSELDCCVEDARQNGYDADACGPLDGTSDV